MFPGFTKVVLIFCLATLSWFATYTGMLELIIANSGEIGLVYRFAVAFAVATLMLMIIYILDALFSPLSWWLRLLYIFGYVFLTLISVGFGFGFFWKVLESRAEATRSAEAAIVQVQSALQHGQVRLGQLQSTLDTLTDLSRRKAVEEREQGTSCPNSKPGDGPRRRLRDADAEHFAFVSQFVGDRARTVGAEFDSLNGDLSKLLGGSQETVDKATGTRNAFLRDVARKLDLTITRFNALRTDPQLVEHRDRLAARAQRTQFDDGSGGTFLCPDVQLQSALGGVVKAIDGLPEIERPDVAAVEGSEAIVEAFRRLTTSAAGLLSFKLPPSPEELRELQRQAVQSAEATPQGQAALSQAPGLGSRDYIPLFVAIFVDFCILLVSVNRPINRFHMLRNFAREAREGPVAAILAKFHDSHQGGLAQEFEIFQHVVFDFLGDYYVAVPLSSRRTDARYLANLFVSLEGKGIVDRVMLPPAWLVRRRLAKQNSDFANEPLFRVYRFRNGAWSKMVLDAVLGARSSPVAMHASEEPRAEHHAPAGDVSQANGHAAPAPAATPATAGDRGEEEARLALPRPYRNGNEGRRGGEFA